MNDDPLEGARSLRYLYSILFYLATPFVFLRLTWKSIRSADYRRRWGERLGWVPFQLDKCIWVHAVSVGETIAAIPLIKSLKSSNPNLPILVTNMTPTGAARVKAAFGNDVHQCFIPYDYPDAVARFLKKVNPIVGVIMETELWPNLFAVCKKKNIPLVLANARLSEKSASGYKKISTLTKQMLNAIDVLASQGKADAERFIELGISKQRVTITGNLKFDLQLPGDLTEKSNLLKKQLGEDRLIWVAASTHPTEEELILNAHKLIQAKFPNAMLILVPRHPDRFNGIADLIRQKGFKLQRRTDKEIVINPDVYLGDTMGELLLMYSVSDVAFIGGSFVKVGGHNMLEAAALSKPILTGPELFNFAEISEKLIFAKGMYIVQSVKELANEVISLLKNPEYCQETGSNAFNVVQQNRGSLQKQLDLIQSLIKTN